MSEQALKADADRGEELVGEFVLIPGGKFMMGSDKCESEQPVHEVIISQNFEMGKYQVTQEQWEVVMGNNPSHFFKREDNLPVERISWHDVQAFIEKLNSKSNKYDYRLPTEAEWEYACRAGSTGDYAGDLDAMAWYISNSDGTSGHTTRPVGQWQANAWELCDMHGNVWEWCSDWYGEYSSETVTDPIGAISGSCRVIRGGSWSMDADYCRSAFRHRYTPNSLGNNGGIRLVRTPR